MDLLIVLSTTTAYIFSVVSFVYQVRGQPLSTGEFFETSTLLVTLIMLGRLVPANCYSSSGQSRGTDERDIDARLLQYDDVFKVIPDSRVATDGTVISGISEVDESTVTGEEKLVEKKLGSSVIAGSVNGSGILVVQLTHLPSDNTISQIASMVAVGKAIRHESATSAVVQALTYSISVLIVSCPCAIGLAVPIAVVIAGGVAAKRGVVFKSAETIEIARKVVHVIFDKTGTLTQGQLSVSAEEYLSESWALAASVVLGLTSNIKHPVSSAVAKHLRRQGVEPTPLQDVTSITSKGIEGNWNGVTIRAGNSRWLGVEESPLVQSLLSKGLTVFCVSSGDQLLAAFGLEDSLRPDANTVVSELTKRGITVSIVSGDDDIAVESVAIKLGISAAHLKSKCTPADKQQYIKDIINIEGKTVLFCGDGTNDAVALAQASIGVHMSEGTDVTQSAADAVLVRPSLSGILTLIDLSRASFRRIVFNFAWAFVYNLFAILLAAGAFVNARIPPQYAGLGELVSVLPIVLIALQLSGRKVSDDCNILQLYSIMCT
ncbi:MAG: hypothetical protein M1840_001656 [Geoglossum simile]|nr:MAG: hypothetical protein M1840_001656 [Geoglossum simile]